MLNCMQFGLTLDIKFDVKQIDCKIEKTFPIYQG